VGGRGTFVNRANHIPDFCRIRRFCDVSVKPRFRGQSFIMFLAPPGDGDDADAWTRRRTYSSACLIPIYARHADIEQYYLGLKVRERRETRCTIVNDSNSSAHVLDQQSDDIGPISVIVNDKHVKALESRISAPVKRKVWLQITGGGEPNREFTSLIDSRASGGNAASVHLNEPPGQSQAEP